MESSTGQCRVAVRSTRGTQRPDKRVARIFYQIHVGGGIIAPSEADLGELSKKSRRIGVGSAEIAIDGTSDPGLHVLGPVTTIYK